MLALILHACKVMLKILQASLQQYSNWELPDIQARFRKDRGTRDQIANTCWIIQKLREYQEISTSVIFAMPKSLTVWITANCGKFLETETPDNLHASWEVCVQIKKQQLELDMEQWTSYKLGKEFIMAV